MAQTQRATMEPDDEAEYALVGMGLGDPQLWPSILARVRAEDCGTELAPRVLRFAAAQAATGVLVGLAECVAELGREYREQLAQLRSNYPGDARLPYWCGRVTERAAMRRLGRLAWNLTAATRSSGAAASEIAASTARELADIVAPGMAAKVLSPAQWLDRWEQDTERRATESEAGRLGLSTGIPTLDRDVIVERGHMVLVAAQTGVGKTAFGLSVACAAAQAGAGVLYCNTEMDVTALANRIIANRAGLDARVLRRGWLSPEQWRAARDAKATIRDAWNLHLSEPLAGADPDQLAILARAHKAEFGLDALVMDYMGRLDVTPAAGEREWNVLERAAARFKSLANELQCAAYLLVQRTDEGTIAGSRRMRNDADLVLEIIPADDNTRKRWLHATHVIAVTKSRHSRGGYPIAVVFDGAAMSWTEVGHG